jgi:hypothetical protein
MPHGLSGGVSRLLLHKARGDFCEDATRLARWRRHGCCYTRRWVTFARMPPASRGGGVTLVAIFCAPGQLLLAANVPLPRTSRRASPAFSHLLARGGTEPRIGSLFKTLARTKRRQPGTDCYRSRGWDPGSTTHTANKLVLKRGTLGS